MKVKDIMTTPVHTCRTDTDLGTVAGIMWDHDCGFNNVGCDAEVPLIQAVQAGHQFVYDDLRERLSVARQRIEALLSQLTNPEP